MTTTVFIFFVFVAFIGYQLAAILLNRREIRRLVDMRTAQDTQRSFGELRQKLMLLICEEKVDSRSLMFLQLYQLNTTVMRQPDRYKLIAAVLRKNFLASATNSKGQTIKDELVKEKASWSEPFKHLIGSHSDAMNQLMVNHSPVLRMAFTLANGMRKVGVAIVRHELTLWKKGLPTLASWVSPTNKAFAETQDELRHLAA